jgi:Arc/MetJ-type ribon-helix-helix transcriptional regulator
LADNSDKKRFSVTLTTAYAKALNRLVDEGIYIDHQDAIRDALRRLFEYHGLEPFSKEADAPSEP